MKKGYTEIIFIWDKSGSMQSVYEDALGGFNNFIEDQKEDNDDTRVTLVLFDNQIENKFDSNPIEDIHTFTKKDYLLGGNTALLDAIGFTMKKVGKRFTELKENERPENVIMVIQTDGMENASCTFTNKQIKEMIKHQEEVYNWKVIYLGANLNAFDSGNDIGLHVNRMMDYSNYSTNDAFMATSMSIKDAKKGMQMEQMNTYLEKQEIKSSTSKGKKLS
jgi:uncharacterized protein YegL